jgi:D-alanyl-D-alanine carboxypeptidase
MSKLWHRRSPLAGLLMGAGLLAWAVHARASNDSCLQAELAARPAFSGAALVVHRQRDGTPVRRLAVQGLADEAGTAIGPDTRFNLGSASKMFTAVAVVQLVAQGRLALDAPIGRWVEGLAPPVAAVTLRQLLTHSAGLGNFITPDQLPALQQAKTVEQQMRLVTDDRTRFEPGSRFGYSNTGFLLLGRAVERASGQAFAAYLQEHVFKPAGMLMSSLDPSRPVPAATGFTRLPVWVAGGPGPGAGPGAGPGPGPGALPMGPLRPAAESALPGSPAGSAYSTLADLERFFAALEAGRLVDAAGLQLLTTAQIDASPPGFTPVLQYGMGFGISTWDGRRGFGHNGGAPGVNVDALRFTEDGVLIVVLSNRDPPLAGQVLNALQRAALGGTLCG